MTTATLRRDDGMWEVTTRTIVYAAIGAALYAVLAQFSFLLPGTANVTARPGFAIVTFFGFAFGPIVGLFVGLVGNMIADQISGWGLLTSWNWSIANGVVGLLTGVLAYVMAPAIRNRLLLAAVASAVAVVLGFLVVFSDLWLGTADSLNTALTANYLPVVIANLIVVIILTPILVAAWDPIRDSMGR